MFRFALTLTEFSDRDQHRGSQSARTVCPYIGGVAALLNAVSRPPPRLECVNQTGYFLQFYSERYPCPIAV